MPKTHSPRFLACCACTSVHGAIRNEQLRDEYYMLIAPAPAVVAGCETIITCISPLTLTTKVSLQRIFLHPSSQHTHIANTLHHQLLSFVHEHPALFALTPCVTPFALRLKLILDCSYALCCSRLDLLTPSVVGSYAPSKHVESKSKALHNQVRLPSVTILLHCHCSDALSTGIYRAWLGVADTTVRHSEVIPSSSLSV